MQEGSSLIILLHEFLSPITKLVDFAKKKFEIFIEKLSKIEKILSEFFEHDIMKMIKQIIKTCRSEIHDVLHKEGPPDLSRIDRMKEGLNESINKEKTELQLNAPDENDETIKKLEHAQDILNLDDCGSNAQIQYNASTAKTCAEVMSSSADKLKPLESLEHNLAKILSEQVFEIQKSVTEISQKMHSNSRVELNMSKWRIQSVVKDFKILFQTLTADFDVGRDLKRCIEKLNEAISIMAGVYERIESYTAKTELAAYIANIASSASPLTDSQEFNDVICKLNKTIEVNSILEHYEIAMNAFKQHKFPFAHLYTSQFELPPNLSFDDFDNFDVFGELQRQAVLKITTLEKALNQSKNSIRDYDQDVLVHKAALFYTWKYQEISDVISKLLTGEEIMVKADIARGMNQDAVKFREIAIQLKLANKWKQAELDDKLGDFNVIMTMVGNSYYRCGKRSYCMSVDENIVLEYSIKKNKRGTPINTNEVYRKISNGDFFLSPYTMWRIKLVGKHSLHKFKSEVMDLQLVGLGQYVKMSSTFTSAFSSNILDKHYDFDGIIPFASDMKLVNNF